MSNTIKIAEKYFELSNQSNMGEIGKMFSDRSTYSSADTGVYLGIDQIINMMSNFHASFSKLSWIVKGIKELRPGVAEIDFVFRGITKAGQTVENPGTEYVIVFDDKIQHIEVRSK
ncbi:MAG: hypothetical protein COV70_00770 [Parcubacteria group bacterium CG11_big_fil_rev_8_21_14_0_20_39_22]|nr:MAG: hypothetical protein COV70_00770 [Parcubacteria group bacterium CG11_big_fil_rev_8_21_14_0_20_39_22]